MVDWTGDYNALMKQIEGKPKHEHDCKKCVFKGTVGNFDVYICPSPAGRKYDSLIARYGKDGEYASFPRSSFARVVADHILGQVGDGKGGQVEDPKLPDWMMAILAAVFSGE